MPTSGTPAARTAVPQPPNTSTKVPRNSAVRRWVMVCWSMGFPSRGRSGAVSSTFVQRKPRALTLGG